VTSFIATVPPRMRIATIIAVSNEAAEHPFYPQKPSNSPFITRKAMFQNPWFAGTRRCKSHCRRLFGPRRFFTHVANQSPIKRQLRRTATNISILNLRAQVKSPKQKSACTLRASVEPSWWRIGLTPRWAPPPQFWTIPILTSVVNSLAHYADEF
jgi:hypothetical protein